MAPFALGWLWLTGGAGMGQHDLKVDAFLMLAASLQQRHPDVHRRLPTTAAQCGRAHILPGPDSATVGRADFIG